MGSTPPKMNDLLLEKAKDLGSYDQIKCTAPEIKKTPPKLFSGYAHVVISTIHLF